MKLDNKKNYIPIIKAKLGELTALHKLDASIKPNILPLLEIPLTPWDYAHDEPSKKIEEHLASVITMIKKHWESNSFLLSVSREILNENVELLNYIEKLGAELTKEDNTSLKYSFVVPLFQAPEFYQAIKDSAINLSDFALRLILDSFDFDVNNAVIEEEVNKVLEFFGKQATETTFIVDFGSIWKDDIGAVSLSVKIFLDKMPHLKDWNNMVLSMSSFPDSLACVEKRSMEKFPRTEWSVWKRLTESDLDMKPIYSDYAIAHPLLNEVDPRIINMFASIRYTLNESWLIARGESLRDYGFKQYPELCRDLINSGDYFGSKHCWGDGEIQRYTSEENDKNKTGNSTTWRAIGNNHHFTVVLTQLANLASGA